MPKYTVLDQPVETGSEEDQGRPLHAHLEWFHPATGLLLLWDLEEPVIQVALDGIIIATASKPHWHVHEAVRPVIYGRYCQSIVEDVWTAIKEAGVAGDT